MLSATLENAPSLDPEGNESGERGLMLKIDGIGLSALRSHPGNDDKDTDEERVRGSGNGSGYVSGTKAALGEEEMNSLMEIFDAKMAVLRSVVGNAAVASADTAPAPATNDNIDVLKQSWRRS